MDLEDLVEAELAGEHPEIPDDLREQFGRAMVAHEAPAAALGDVECRAESEADQSPPLLPEDFEVARELGRGGMGVVYLVRQKSLGRLAAVKVLRSGDAAFGLALRRFLDEARHLARLRHPHIVAVHEVGHDGRGEPYFVMDYVDGEPLTAVLARGRMTPTRALAVVKQVGEAVRHAHERGIIHRDLNPGNILIAEDGAAFVTDFGLAQDVTEPADRTCPGGIMGTPAYMAPEQARGQAELVGEATDVHALGTVLYEMLTGRPPTATTARPTSWPGCCRGAATAAGGRPPHPPRPGDDLPHDARQGSLEAVHIDGGLARRHPAIRIGRPPAGPPAVDLPARVRLIRRHWKPLAGSQPPRASRSWPGRCWCRAWPATRRSSNCSSVAGWQHHEGRHDAAAALYAAALDQIDRRDGRIVAAIRAEDEPARRLELLREIQRCVGEIDDPEVAAAIALPVINKNPWISFRRRDLAIARVAFRRAASLGPRPWENEAGRRSDPRGKEAWFFLRLAEDGSSWSSKAGTVHRLGHTPPRGCGPGSQRHSRRANSPRPRGRSGDR